MQLDVVVIPFHEPGSTPEEIAAFAERIAADVRTPLQDATGATWSFHVDPPRPAPRSESLRPTDFIDHASLRMVEGRYDAVVVVTDAPLMGRDDRVVPGLASAAVRVAVLSLDRMRSAPRERIRRPLEAPTVRWNAATLLLHLIGHMVGLRHESRAGDVVMSPFRFDPDRKSLPPFAPQSLRALSERMDAFPQRQDRDEGGWSEIRFHLSSALRHPRQTLMPVFASWAPLLALHLPRLATAAVAPALILVFTAEIWDAGFHMGALDVGALAAVSILGSTVYLVLAQRLILPHKERRYHAEHLAIVNVGIILSVLAAVIGLFAMLCLLVLGIQVFIFPPDLIREWPSLDLATAVINLGDHLRIAGLISSIGVLTGALAGGLESRDVVRYLALFGKEPLQDRRSRRGRHVCFPDRHGVLRGGRGEASNFPVVHGS